jgi:adenylate cyclase
MRPLIPFATLVLAARALVGQCPNGTPPPCAGAAPPRFSVAVLSLDNLSRDTADAYVVDGLADGIATRLGGLPRLEVKRPHGSAVRELRERRADHAAVLGRMLGVSYLVEGSLQRANAQVRVSIRLVHAADGVQAWARDYDRSATDLLAVQADIAADVAREVIGRLLPAERERVGARPQLDPRAEEHFRRGNYLLGQRSLAIPRAISEYDAALRVAPDYVPALSLDAYAHALAVWWGVMPRDSGLLRGFALAERALRLDSLASNAWMARAMLLSSQNPLDQRPAAAAMERAVVLDPRNDEAWHQLAQMRGYLGRFAAADSAIDRALELDPSRAISLVYRAELKSIAHDFAGARRALDSAIAFEPGLAFAFQARAGASLALGDTAAARRDARAALAGGDERVDLRITWAVLDGRENDARRQIASELERLSVAGPMELMNVAAAAAMLGERDALLRIFGVVPAGHLRWYASQFPVFDRYRSDPVLGPLLAAGRPTP